MKDDKIFLENLFSVLHLCRSFYGSLYQMVIKDFSINVSLPNDIISYMHVLSLLPFLNDSNSAIYIDIHDQNVTKPYLYFFTLKIKNNVLF